VKTAASQIENRRFSLPSHPYRVPTAFLGTETRASSHRETIAMAAGVCIYRQNNKKQKTGRVFLNI
jgi:hypothetical protein